MSRRPAVRATRISPPSNQVDRGAVLAPRRLVDYWCAADHHTATPFAADADAPPAWHCAICGSPAALERGTAPTTARPPVFPRTPYEFLMMRRSVADGERILADALAELHRARGRRSPR